MIIKDIIQNYGGTILFYSGSYINLITRAFPNYNWLPWKFKQSPKRFWKDENNIKSYMNWLSEKLNIKTMEDWYKVTSEVNHCLQKKRIINFKHNIT